VYTLFKSMLLMCDLVDSINNTFIYNDWLIYYLLSHEILIVYIFVMAYVRSE